MTSRPVLSDGGTVVLPAGASIVPGRIAVSAIRLPDNYVGMDLDHIRNLTRVLAPDLDAEPVTLSLATPGTYWLISGRHRFVAALVMGRSTIAAIVVDPLVVAP